MAGGHQTAIHEVGGGGVPAACACGWRSLVFGAGKTTGMMDPLQQATDAGDLHQWGMSLRWARRRPVVTRRVGPAPTWRLPAGA